MLTIIKGRIGSGKTTELFNRIRETMRTGKKCILLVPDRVSYAYEQRLCRYLNVRGFIDVEVTSFNRLASGICEYAFGNRKKTLSPSGRTMLLSSCIRRVQPELTLYAGASDRKGFTQRFDSMLSVLENCSFRPEDLRAQAEKLPEGVLKRKLSDIALIYEAFLEKTGENYTDAPDRLVRAGEALADYPPLAQAALFVDGFDTFTTVLYGFLGRLLCFADLTIALGDAGSGKDGSLYRVSKAAADRLTALAQEASVPVRTVFIEGCAAGKPSELTFLASALYAYPAPEFPGVPEAIRLKQYASPLQEITAVAEEISRRVRAGARYRDFAVFCGDTELYAPLVGRTFRLLGVPVYADVKIPAVTHPVAQFLFSALKCAADGYTVAHVSAFVYTGLLTLTEKETNRFLSFLSHAGVTPQELQCGLLFRRGSDEECAAFEELRQRVIPPLENFCTQIKASPTVKEKVTCCYDFLVQNGICEKAKRMMEQCREENFPELEQATGQLWKTTVRLLEELYRLLGEDRISVRHFLEVLQEGFASSPAATIPPVVDTVLFGDLQSAAMAEPSCTFLVGVNDGIIPAVPADERMVTPAESELLAQNGMEITHSIETLDTQARYAIYAACLSPSRELALSYPLFSSSGAPLKPSYLLRRFSFLFPRLETEAVSYDQVEHVLADPLTPEQAMLAVALDNVSSRRSALLCENIANTQAAALLRAVERKKEELTPEEAKALFSPEGNISVSRLETFAACPFRHFIQYGLRPEEVKDFAASAIDVGILLHRVLELFSRHMLQDGPLSTPEELYAFVGTLFDREVPEIRYGVLLSTARQREVNSRLKSIACQCARCVQDEWQIYAPLGEEIFFGKGKYPPIEVVTEYGTLYLEGKIDRADTMQDGEKLRVRIVDYKTGLQKFSTRDVENGTDIQLLIYMKALLSCLGSNAVPDSARYVMLDELEPGKPPAVSGPASPEYDEESFAELLEKGADSARRSAEGILSGNIRIAPLDEKSCKNCAYRLICRSRSAEKDEESEAIQNA